ncbi:MAG: AraC family transcriptional regulator [Alphaproteobacteria bacterium]|nr:AraC family transcriptional regulator [Alphaproteobacteria bacterium]MBU1515828.1 AraC family transcriptional regulator [Alphaproteobacteria bacterium]MBU2094050.1 AraC family transcriptional regulator [Alphaproteobacteria bacterium]MBU2151402.1 AraC family transcriptional regulator [Alphaproteobacteria bacterium]MBU2305322.1 AraC family transcriptional regulator [Alphaproteobacteria bacterium]
MSQLGRSAGLTGFLELAGEVGVDAYALAQAVGLPPEALTDPDLRIAVEMMGRMFEMAAEQSGVEDFALRIAEQRRISNMGAVGLVIREQPTLRKALQAYARYQWLQNDAYSLVLEEFGDQAVLRIYGPAWQQRQVQELSVATAVRTLKAVMGEAWKPLEVRFTHAAPRRLDTYRRVLGVTPLFDQDCMAIVLRQDDLETAIATADPAMARQVALFLDRMAADRSVALRDKVADLIVALLPDGVCSVERVAQHLGMDRRTLHRRLLAEETTFSGILDATRQDMAASLLLTSDRPLQSVADLLGFSSLSAFAHWFRRKFGQSASAYRAANAGQAIRPSTALVAAA